jgi:hypothetical protein
MKRIFTLGILSFAALVTLSCVQEINTTEPEVVPGKHYVTFSASTPLTRTSIVKEGTTYSALWTADDEANFHIFENGNEGVAEMTITNNGAKATFKAIFDDGEVGPFHYTAILAKSFDADTKIASILSSQTPAGNNIDGDADVLVAKEVVLQEQPASTVEQHFQFKRVVSINKMTLKGLEVGESVTDVKISGDKQLAAAYNFNTDAFDYTAGGNAVQLGYTDNNTITSAGTFDVYFVCAPVDDAILSIEVKTKDSENAVRTYKKTFTRTISFDLETVAEFVANVTCCEEGGSEPETVEIFKETFDQTNGTGGNDNQWSGNIATNNITADKLGWTFSNNGGGKYCIKMGTGSAFGSATTPALGITTSPATITFKAAAWSTESSQIQLSIPEGCAGTISSVLPAGNLPNNEWGAYTATIIDGNENTKITFKCSNKRFFLDEVVVTEEHGSDPNIVSLTIANNTDIGSRVTEATISISSNKAWTVTSSDDNLASPVKISGTAADNSFTVNFAEPNTGTEDKVATLSVVAGAGDYAVTKIITITQKGLAFASIADLNSLASSTESNYSGTLTNAIVSFVPGDNDAIIKDGTGSILLHKKDHGLLQGQSFTGGVDVEVLLYSGCSELTDCSAEFTGEPSVVAPANMALSTLVGHLDLYQNAYVKVEHLVVTAVSNKNVTVEDGDNTYVVYTSYGDATCEVGDILTVVGTVAHFGTNDQIKVWSSSDITKTGHVVPSFSISITSPTETGCQISASVDGQPISSGSTVEYGKTVSLTATVGSGYVFNGWVVTGASVVDPSATNTSFVVDNSDVTISALFSETNTDVLNLALTGVSGTSYTNWQDKTSNTDAVYAGNSAGSNNSIQLRSSGNNSGIVTTVSGGYAKKITVSWNTNTPDDRVLNVYGKKTAYSSASDLYGYASGTLVGTIKKGVSTELTIPYDCKYIGLRSNDGAIYLSEIRIKWSEDASGNLLPTYSVNIAEGITNGSVTSNKSSGIDYGESVTLTVSPYENYKLQTLNVDGAVVTSLVDDEGKYTFNMPDHNVSVQATFVSTQGGGDTNTYSLTPDQTSTGSSATAYITSLTEFTYDEVTWKMNQWNPSTLQIKTNQSSATGEFRFYNTTPFPGRISKVVISFSALTISDGTKLMFVGGDSPVTTTAGGTAGTWDGTAKTLTWTPGTSDNYTYFAFYQNGKAASGNNYLANTDAIVVTYE